MSIIYDIKQKVADLYYSVRDWKPTQNQLLGATLLNTGAAGAWTGACLDSIARGDAKAVVATGIFGAVNALIALGCYKAYKQEESREPVPEEVMQARKKEWIGQNVLIAMLNTAMFDKNKNHKWDPEGYKK